MAATRPRLNFIPKILLGVALILSISLTACNPSWMINPLAKYIKEKTGFEVKIEKISAGLHPLLLGGRGIQLNYKKNQGSWEIKIPDFKVYFSWSLTWEGLPWPEVNIEKITLNHPSVLIRIPHPRKKTDWKIWLMRLPPLRQIEINDLQGRLELGRMYFNLSSGTQVKASIDPKQGGTVDYRIISLQGVRPENRFRFVFRSQGSIKLIGLTERPIWKGTTTLLKGNLFYRDSSIEQLSGRFQWIYEDQLLTLTASPARIQRVIWKAYKASWLGQGGISLSGTLRVKDNRFKGAVMSGIEVKLNDVDIDFERGKYAIRGPTSGEVDLQGPLASPSLKARISTGKTEMNLPPVFTQGLEVTFEAQGKFPILSFSNIFARADRTHWQLPKGPLIILDPESRFTALFKTHQLQFYLQNINLKSDNWGPVAGSLVFDLKKSRAPSGWMSHEPFPILKFLKHFFPKVGTPFPEEIPLRGTIEWSREFSGAPIDLAFFVTPVPFSFRIPTTEWEGEDFNSRIEGTGQWYFKDKKISLKTDLFLSRGTLSRIPWVFDFSQNPLEGRLEATLDAKKETGFLIGSLDLHYDPLGHINISGEWPFRSAVRSFSSKVKIQDLPLEQGFPLLISDPLADSHPFLNNISLQGILETEFSLVKNEKEFDLKGRMAGKGINLDFNHSTLSFQKGLVDLPLHFSFSAVHPQKEDFSEGGFFRIENFQSPLVSIDRLQVPILAGTNHFEIQDSVVIPLWGGEAVISNLEVSNPWRNFVLNTSFSFHDLDLAQLFPEQDISGTLQGDLGPIRIDQEKTDLPGVLKAHVFEGTVEGKNLAIVHPFSPDRAFHGDLFFDHLNLELITRRFSFGKITGFVNGQATHLSIRHKRPERFRLLIRTQEVPGVPKIINLKAIENIGLLGTGWGELDSLRKGINRFISEYAYQKIGFSCSLQKDRFRLRGTIIEDGIEYLVKKPGWFGIDVINKNPDNEILFSDMLDRIQRIKKTP